MQSGAICLWAAVDSDAPKEIRRFEIFGTGHMLPAVAEDRRREYLNSVLMHQDNLVFHVYELVKVTAIAPAPRRVTVAKRKTYHRVKE